MQQPLNFAGIYIYAFLVVLTPFLSLLISAVVLGERISLRAFAALLLIVGGILLQGLPSGRTAKRNKENQVRK